MSHCRERLFKTSSEDVEKTRLADLAADSLNTFELILALENEWTIRISDADYDGIETVGDIVRYILEQNSDPGSWLPIACCP